MLMMGLELMLNGVLLAVIGFWSFGLGGAPEGQLLAIVVMAVTAVEMVIGFALAAAVSRKPQADITESLTTLGRWWCGGLSGSLSSPLVPFRAPRLPGGGCCSPPG